MGNITELSQGNLDGLKKQVCECIDHAHEQGYKEGKNEPKEVKAVNVEDTSEYQIGYKVGYDTGYNEGYNKGLEDARLTTWAMLTSKNTGEIFTKYGTVSDILGSLPMKEIRDRIEAYEKEKKAEEEIKVGDIVRYATDIDKMIVTRVTNEKIETLDKNGCVESWKKTAALHKWGNENVADKLQALFEGSKESLDE